MIDSVLAVVAPEAPAPASAAAADVSALSTDRALSDYADLLRSEEI